MSVTKRRNRARRHHFADRLRAWKARIKAYNGTEPATMTECRKIWRNRKRSGGGGVGAPP